MHPPSDSSGPARGFLPPEFHGATPWVIDMDDAQRKAHAEQMSANAEKIRAEAADIRGRNRWNKLWYGLSCAAVYALVFGVGIGTGILYVVLHGQR
jgi:hypothetical protein